MLKVFNEDEFFEIARNRGESIDDSRDAPALTQAGYLKRRLNSIKGKVIESCGKSSCDGNGEKCAKCIMPILKYLDGESDSVELCFNA